MISTWRRRRAARRAGKLLKPQRELSIPDHFRCPITLDLMNDPVTLSTGITYDRAGIERWIDAGKFTCPITNQELKSLDPIPNHTIRMMIQDWCVENRNFGVERIPTPRVPVSAMEVDEMLVKIAAAGRRGDGDECSELVNKMKKLAKESERNKKCILSSNGCIVLCSVFEAFSKVEVFSATAMEDILSVLTIYFPIDDEAKVYLSSSLSLNSLVWFLKSGDLGTRRNAILVLKELQSEEVAKIEGVLEALYTIIKEPICPATTKASLMVIYQIMIQASSNEKIVEQFADMGLVSLLIEILVDAEKNICERGLAVLDEICSTKRGRTKGYDHALLMPVLVKKILRVSDTATSFSVSILWKLIKNENGENEGDHCLIANALQVGCFQKLLLMLQVGCGEKTKEKATELLRILNVHRAKLECIDSMDFKDLKRGF